MADTKITGLAAIGANPIIPSTFPLPMVDLTDTSMAASGTTKKVTVNQILGAGGIATLASATITGDLTVRTNKLAVTSSGVGFGTASPSAPIQVGDTTGSPEIRLSGASTAAAGPYLTFYKGGTRKTLIGNEAVLIGSGTSDALMFYTEGGNGIKWNIGSSTPSMTLDSSGNLGLGVTPSAGGGVLQLKSGITFPATQVASSDANTLDDYEEGTFTAGITFGGASTGITYSSNTFRYTKIGRVVTVHGYLSLSNKGSSTGNVAITGLPFGVANSNSAYSAISIWCNAITQVTGGNVVQGYGVLNNTIINLSLMKTDGTLGSLNDTNFANNSELILSFTYTI